MKIKSTYQNRKTLFKRWTRTPWAVFASLKVVVHNHCTRISSFKDSLLKQQGADKTELARLLNEIGTISESEDIGIPWDKEVLVEYPLLRILHTPNKVTEAAPVRALSYCHISLSINLIISVGIFYTPII